MCKYRIIERTWSDGRKDYEVQKYSRKWYYWEYKWRTAKQTFGDESGFWKVDAIFSTEIEAKFFVTEQTKKITQEKCVYLA